jgi:hypothetical protein
VYIDAKDHAVIARSDGPVLTSLEAALKAVREDALVPGLSISQRMSVARQLARAVLQFDRNPWLGTSWNSRRIRIAHGKMQDEDAESEAFITARINGPQNKVGKRTLYRVPLWSVTGSSSALE